jgi:ATP-binding cassette subfamily B protein
LEDFAIKGRYLYENKILGHVEVLLNRRVKMANENFERRRSISTKYAKKRQISQLPMAIFQTGTRLYLYYLAILQVLTLGTAQITSSAIERFITNISRLIRQANDVFQNYLFITDYQKFMSLPEENQTIGTPIPATLTQGIEFRDVWFKYDHSPHWILKGVNFKVGPQENIAIVGENGAGKTTLIKLICRFYQPQKGEILLNGRNITDFNIKNYRHSISALFQDFAQYPFSVEDNIRFGDIDKKKTKLGIKKAAKLTGITNFVNTLPLGFQNPLAKDKLVFLVSHRFSTVRKADKIMVLENGQVLECGTHSELINLNGRYRELFSLQAQSYQ